MRKLHASLEPVVEAPVASLSQHDALLQSVVRLLQEDGVSQVVQEQCWVRCRPVQLCVSIPSPAVSIPSLLLCIHPVSFVYSNSDTYIIAGHTRVTETASVAGFGRQRVPVGKPRCGR